MEALFLQILSMSISASWLIVAVILIRFLLKKAPKGFRYVLWAMVAVRLLCPVFIESDFSLIPTQDMISDVGEAVKPVVPMNPDILDGDNVIPDDAQNDNVQNNDVQNQAPQENQGQINNIESIILPDNDAQDNSSQNTVTAEKRDASTVMAWIWMVGIVALFLYAIVSYGLLCNTIKASIQREDNLWVCDGIQSPFILGLLRPQIYIPSYIEENHIPYIVAHEKEHIRCKDNWWKVLGFVLLTLHWFNPLVWIAYVLMCKDIELACDERVIRSMSAEDKKNYSKSLLLCSSPKHFISACPVAFGEVGVKERIKKIVDYRKPSVWIIGSGIVVCLIIVVGFLTNPKAESKDIVEIRVSSGPEDVVTKDAETIEKIVNDVNDLVMIPVFPSLPSGGWSYVIQTYDADGNIIDDILILGDDTVKGDYFVYKAINGKFDTEYYDELIREYQVAQRLEEMTKKDELPKEKLEWFATAFFNNDENRITNMFLTSEYNTAEDINLECLFYHGANGYGNAPVSDEEKQLLAQKDPYGIEEPYVLDIAKTTRQEMEAVLQRYMNMSFWETNQIGLNDLRYLPEYEAYYKIAGDAMITKYAFEQGWTDAEGNIVLEYYDALSGINTERFHVTLKLVDGNYCFVSNVSASEDRNDETSKEWPEHLLTKENLKWFETEFFNLEDNRITNQFLTSEYQTPADISLRELFYDGNGIVGGENYASETEKQLLGRYIEDIYTDVARTTRKDMNDILKKYMGISLEETNKVEIDSMHYLAEYDAYYCMHGDTNYNRYTMEKGFFNEDGTITLLYKIVSDYRNEPRYIVTLKPVGDSYQFISNMKIGNDN